ncbi:unnamed protein product [Rhizophagus irregularis]|nr:unnamed protein product [Rhizophagus irregularis]CAB5388254.1 unnamed protein product [Rhizophagus irregularis]
MYFSVKQHHRVFYKILEDIINDGFLEEVVHSFAQNLIKNSKVSIFRMGVLNIQLADTVVIPNEDQPILLLIMFKNFCISNLMNMPSTRQQQVEKSQEFLNYNEDHLLGLQLKTNSYNIFKNIKGQFDDAYQEL